MSILKIALSLLALSITTEASAQIVPKGRWYGPCVRPNHDPVKGNVIIAESGTTTFFGGATTNVDIRYPHIEFMTTAGSSGTPRHFVGSFQNDGHRILGTITQADQKWGSCTFDYAGPS